MCLPTVQSPVKSSKKGKKGAKKAAGEAGSAELQLSGVLHVMKLLAARPSEKDAMRSPPASPSPRRRGPAAAADAPLQPELVNHLVDGLFDQYDPAPAACSERLCT
jgi:hypothetical protein